MFYTNLFQHWKGQVYNVCAFVKSTLLYIHVHIIYIVYDNSVNNDFQFV